MKNQQRRVMHGNLHKEWKTTAIEEKQAEPEKGVFFRQQQICIVKHSFSSKTAAEWMISCGGFVFYRFDLVDAFQQCHCMNGNAIPRASKA